MTKRTGLWLALPAAAIALVGCLAGSDESDGDFGAAAQPQIDRMVPTWRTYTLKFPDGTELARIRGIKTSGCGLTGGTEYWDVNRDSLNQLGTGGITITTTDGPTAYPPGPCYPPDPCHPTDPAYPPDPCYTSQQSFTQPINPTGGWGTGWTTDPVSGGSLYTNTSGLGLRLKKAATTNLLTEVTWYQVIPSTLTPQNIAPSGSFSAASSLIVPRRYRGYNITGTP